MHPSRIVNEDFWDKIADRRFDMYADQKDGGWLHIRRELKKKAIERAKNVARRSSKHPAGTVTLPTPCAFEDASCAYSSYAGASSLLAAVRACLERK